MKILKSVFYQKKTVIKKNLTENLKEYDLVVLKEPAAFEFLNTENICKLMI